MVAALVMFTHVPRVLWSVFRGAYLKPQPLTGLPSRPHIYSARVNALLDIDQFMHMNNASYAVHFEMARWEMGAANGLTAKCFKENIAFIVASSAIRFRKELKPLQPFEIHTECHSADERSMHIVQIAKQGDRVYAGQLCRAVLRQGRELVSPRKVLMEVAGGAEYLPPSSAGGADGEDEGMKAALATLEEGWRG